MDATVGRLHEGQVRSVLSAATRAPSLHNTQPWRFSCTGSSIELYADYRYSLPATDPDNRELILACGAALFNLRLAIRAQDVFPVVRLLPSMRQRDLLAVVTPERSRAATAAELRLVGAIERRATNRHPFATTAVPVPVRNELRRAAEAELARMATLHDGHLPVLRSLVREAHRAQQRSAAFGKEWRAWVNVGAEYRDGVPYYSSGPRPRSDETWMLRDFTNGLRDPRLIAPRFEPAPLLVVIGAATDSRLAWLHAGQAMQRVLLTAATAGLSASFLSQVIEVEQARLALRGLLGDTQWPQALLRLGYGLWPVPRTPRRPLADVAGSVRDD
jgi:nitroreductase